MRTMKGMFSLHIDAAQLDFQFPHAVYAIVSYSALKWPCTVIVLGVHIEFPAIVLKHLKDPAFIAAEAEKVARHNAEMSFAKKESEVRS